MRKLLIMLNAMWRPRNLRAIVVEDQASGQSIIQELRRESGVAVIARRWPGDKVTHLASVLPLIEGGRVFLPHKDTADPDIPTEWLGDFLTEIEQFPSGAFDDQVDAVTLLLSELSRTAITPDMMVAQFDAFNANSLNAKDPKSLEGLYGKSLNSQLQNQQHWRGWGE